MFSQEAQLWVQMCTSCPDNLVLILDLQFTPSKKPRSKQTKKNLKAFPQSSPGVTSKIYCWVYPWSNLKTKQENPLDELPGPEQI